MHAVCMRSAGSRCKVGEQQVGAVKSLKTHDSREQPHRGGSTAQPPQMRIPQASHQRDQTGAQARPTRLVSTGGSDLALGSVKRFQRRRSPRGCCAANASRLGRCR
jgi:hypothetical protein